MGETTWFIFSQEGRPVILNQAHVGAVLPAKGGGSEVVLSWGESVFVSDEPEGIYGDMRGQSEIERKPPAKAGYRPGSGKWDG